MKKQILLLALVGAVLLLGPCGQINTAAALPCGGVCGSHPHVAAAGDCTGAECSVFHPYLALRPTCPTGCNGAHPSLALRPTCGGMCNLPQLAIEPTCPAGCNITVQASLAILPGGCGSSCYLTVRESLAILPGGCGTQCFDTVRESVAILPGGCAGRCYLPAKRAHDLLANDRGEVRAARRLDRRNV